MKRIITISIFEPIDDPEDEEPEVSDGLARVDVENMLIENAFVDFEVNIERVDS